MATWYTLKTSCVPSGSIGVPGQRPCISIMVWLLVVCALASYTAVVYVAAYHHALTSNSDVHTSCGCAHIQSDVEKKEDMIEQHTDAKKEAEDHAFLWNGERLYLEAAKSSTPVTDKVTRHVYQIMYGRFLLPYYHRHPTMKMLEIGLGCNMLYGPGASVYLHKKLFPKADLWEAELTKACVERHRNGILNGVQILTGSQGNNTVLDRWIQLSGGDFDVVIDDGGHRNCEIWTSFQKLWPTVKPGGLYFIEDMQVAKLQKYRRFESSTCNRTLIVPEKLKEFMDDPIYDVKRVSDIKFIFCQSEACVLGKKE